jgi:hypothetical protein
MQQRSCAMQQRATNTLHHPTRVRHRTLVAAGSRTTAPAAALRPPQHAAAAAPSRTLFIGGLPAKTAADQLEELLAAVCTAAGCVPTRVQVSAGCVSLTPPHSCSKSFTPAAACCALSSFYLTTHKPWLVVIYAEPCMLPGDGFRQ